MSRLTIVVGMDHLRRDVLQELGRVLPLSRQRAFGEVNGSTNFCLSGDRGERQSYCSQNVAEDLHLALGRADEHKSPLFLPPFCTGWVPPMSVCLVLSRGVEASHGLIHIRGVLWCYWGSYVALHVIWLSIPDAPVASLPFRRERRVPNDTYEIPGYHTGTFLRRYCWHYILKIRNICCNTVQFNLLSPVVDPAQHWATRRRRVGELGLNEDLLHPAHALVKGLVKLGELLQVNSVGNHAIRSVSGWHFLTHMSV